MTKPPTKFKWFTGASVDGEGNVTYYKVVDDKFVPIQMTKGDAQIETFRKACVALKVEVIKELRLEEMLDWLARRLKWFTGEFKLTWIDEQGRSNYNHYPCLHDALEKAGTVHSQGGANQSLMNWFGEDACPPDQLPFIAKMRAEIQQENAEHKAMENNPAWGSM